MTTPQISHKGPIAWMARHGVAANLLMIILLAGGVWTAFNIQKEVFPQFQMDVVEVRVSYPGASPEEVEKGILLPVEEAVKAVQGIKEMTSTAYEGSGRINLELVAGTDRMKAFQDVDQAVNRIRTFPDDAEEPEVRLQDRQRDVMEIGLYGDVDIWTLRKLGEQVRDRLMGEPAISQVVVDNVPDYVTHVEIDQQRLREFGLTHGEVAERIEAAARDIPAGSVATRQGEILLRLKERKQWAEQIQAIPIITGEAGATLTLGDIAQVWDGFEEEGLHGQFNAQPSVEIEIFRIGQQSPLEIAAAVEKVIEELKVSLPEGVQVRIDSNRAQDFNDRLSLLLRNGGLAVLIVLLILTLFLEYHLAFWIMMGMTISFVGGILFLPSFGVSVNMISMFGFLVALGIVVDDAIVVGENIYDYQQRGMSFLDAAIRGAREIAMPVTFSILTTIVTFLPVMFLPGTTGKFWWPLPAVVITVLAVSLLEALFILPAHLARRSSGAKTALGHAVHRRQQAVARAFDRFVDNWYQPFLGLCLRYRYVTLSSGLALLLVCGAYAYSDHMGMIMMPEVAADEIEAGVRLPEGTTHRQAAQVAMEVTANSQRMFEEHDLHQVAEGIKTNVRGQDFIDVEIVMKPPAERDMSAAQVIRLWRDSIGDIEGVDRISFEAERGPGGWRDDIAIDLSHSNIEVLARASQELLQELERFANTRDVDDSYRTGKAQFDFTLLPQAQLLGLSPQEVGRQLRDAFYGAVALRQLRGTNEIEIRVKLTEAERNDVRALENFVLQLPGGGEAPLFDMVRIQRGEAFSSIDRRDGRRVVTVSSDVEPKSATTQVLDRINSEVLPQLRANHPGLTWTFQGAQADMRESTSALWGGFGMALFIIYALLAVAFGNYVQPLIVMTAIPFGIVGAVIGHILLGFNLSLISLMGVVALSGIVVNGALIMVDHANRHRENLTAFQAIHAAGVRRFRPIMLTTLTTFGGLAPIIMETSSQAQYLIPMAISLGFGIVFATSIMLVIVPCIYLVVEDLAGDKVFAGEQAGEAA